MNIHHSPILEDHVCSLGVEGQNPFAVPMPHALLDSSDPALQTLVLDLKCHHLQILFCYLLDDDDDSATQLCFFSPPFRDTEQPFVIPNWVILFFSPQVKVMDRLHGVCARPRGNVGHVLILFPWYMVALSSQALVASPVTAR